MKVFDHVRKYFPEVFRKKFRDNTKRAPVQNPRRENSVVESFFNEIVGKISRAAILVEKSLRQGGLPVSILELLALLQEGLARAPFF